MPDSPLGFALVPVFVVMMLLVPVVPVLWLYRHALPIRQQIALALHPSTQLPLVVAITAPAVSQGAMPARAVRVGVGQSGRAGGFGTDPAVAR
jgi:hypothetical protein